MKPTFRKTIKDKRLDEMSDKVRRGVPMSMEEVKEVIEYQEVLKNKLNDIEREIKFFKVK